MTGVASSGEFARIATYFAPLAAGYPGAFGLGDDAAVVAPSAGAELVITTDTIVAGVHYIGDEAPDLIAQKLLRVNLSDLAAMGAAPRAYTLNLALPPTFDDAWIAAFAAGLAADQDRYGIVLIGGDSVATPGPATLSVTGLGEVPIGGALRRNGARPGDIVFVSGTIGDAALGLLAARGSLALSCAAALIERYRSPRPRLALGRKLRGLVHATTDISDGLVADLGHIVAESGVAARIDAGAVPLSGAARAALAAAPNLIETILTGGDDYELVFCAPRAVAPRLAVLASETDVPITAIGAIQDGEKVGVFDAAGAPIRLTRSGYSHG
jgi:thiamine-monophosphate kinase